MEILMIINEVNKLEKYKVIEKLKRDAYSYLYIKEELQNDRDIVMAAIASQGNLLDYLSANYKNDKEIVLIAVKENGFALKYASDELRRDKEVVLTAINENGHAIEFGHESLRNDREIALIALRKNISALEYISKELIADKEFLYQLRDIKDSLKKWSPEIYNLLEKYEREEELNNSLINTNKSKYNMKKRKI